MKILNYISLIVAIFVLTSCSKSPDHIFINGKIYTLDSKNSVSEAIAVKEGKIIDIGDNSKIKEKYGDKNVIDLQGKTVLPGFIDMEGSLVEFARNLNFINLMNAKSIKEVTELVKANTIGKKENSWIVGFGFNELNFKDEELAKLDKSLLDDVAKNYNVYILNVTGDMVWCNSKLLQTLQITNLTPDPKDGEIEKNDKGELTGILVDAAVNLVKEKTPEISKEDLKNSVEKATKELAKYGITEIHDRTINKSSIDLFKELIDSNKFNTKIYCVLSVGDDTFEEYLKKGIEENYKNQLSVRSVSIDYDGALELQAASMKDGYKVENKNTYLYASNEEIETNMKKALDKKFQFCIKSVGDNAVSNNLAIIEKVLKEKPTKNHRTVLEYIEFIQPADIKKLGELNIIPSVRPDMTMDNIQILDGLVKPENAKNLGQWNSILQSCNNITAGSNFPFGNTISPLSLIHILVNRTPLDTGILSSIGQNQKLSLLEAIKAFTVYAAYAGFEEESKGSLEVNKYADFVVLSDDIFNFDSKKINQIKILKTIINGNVVYSN